MITNFYTPADKIARDTLTIEGEEAKHILSVLRHKIGDEIYVVDGQGTKYKVRIEKTSKGVLQAKILSRTHMENEPDCRITLAQAICRRERMDFLIEKTTEIGVSSIIPIMTEKNTVKINDVSRERKKTDRWRKIAIAAMKQSLRTVLPEIHDVIGFDQLLSRIKDFDLSLIASLDKDSKNLKQCEQLKAGVKSVLLIVGPEAGFTEEELSQAKAMGAIPITLGCRRLRTETAGVLFASLVLHELS
jgi:16S rRNA (uracil1498-N3)-methyltransferase